MRIESIIRRIGGTIVHLGEALYHFKEQDDGAHIAEVEDQDHVDCLLGIPEGYRVARDLRAGVAIPPKIIPQTPRTPAPPANPPAPAPQTAGAEGSEGDGQSEGEGEGSDDDGAEGDNDGETGDGEAGEGDGQGAGQATGDTLDREELIRRYTAKFGSAPPAGVKTKSLISALREDSGEK